MTGNTTVTLFASKLDLPEGSAAANFFREQQIRLQRIGRISSLLEAIRGQQQIEMILIDCGELKHYQTCDCLRRLRVHTSVPIVVQGVSDSPQDRTILFELGADQIIDWGRPDEARERINATIRRLKISTNGQSDFDVLEYGHIKLERRKHLILIDGEAVHFRPIEFNTLVMFLENPNRVLSRETIYRRIWGDDPNPTDTIRLNVAISRLRKKIKTKDHQKVFITTIATLGYMLTFVREFS